MLGSRQKLLYLWPTILSLIFLLGRFTGQSCSDSPPAWNWGENFSWRLPHLFEDVCQWNGVINPNSVYQIWWNTYLCYLWLIFKWDFEYHELHFMPPCKWFWHHFFQDQEQLIQCHQAKHVQRLLRRSPIDRSDNSRRNTGSSLALHTVGHYPFIH